MNSLEKRVSKLEPTSVKDDIRVILIVPMEADEGKPAVVQPTVIGVTDTKTEDFLPLNPGESMEDFEKRAEEWAKERNPGVSLLMLTFEGDRPGGAEG